jgi:hypothetical protein
MRLSHRRQRRTAARLPDVPCPRLDNDRSLAREGAVVTGSVRETPSEPPLSTAERTEKLELLIAKKLQHGYWVESQGDTEAVLVSLGPRRWFGRVGPHSQNTREAVTIDEQGNTITATLPKRRS